jgi:phytoene dehydrogenase-like protein
MRKKLNPHYDVIVIGSGMGGLTAALLHAKFGMQKVLLVEQHFKLGGFTQSFSRGKYTWDVGLHYLGAMSQGAFPRKIMDLLTRRQVAWRALPDPFEVFHFPDFTTKQPIGMQRYVDKLKAAFPDEPGMDDYHRDLRRARNWGYLYFASKVLPRPLSWLPRLVAGLFYGPYGRKTLIDSLDEYFQADDVKALLAGPCGDYGLSPSEASLYIHATIFFHYAQGGYRPEGSAQTIARAIEAHLLDLGVDIAVGHRAEEILVAASGVKGVRLTPVKGERALGPSFNLKAGRVVSAVGARNTYLHLLAPPWVPPKLRASMDSFPPGTSMVIAYLGLKEDPVSLGFKGENHWFYQSANLEQLHQMRVDPENKGVPVVYASFDRRPGSNGETVHTATLIAPACYQAFLDCGVKGTWQRRSSAYDKCKAAQGQALIDLVEKEIPGFRQLVDTMVVSTPLSVEYFSLHPRGEAYGLPATPERYDIHALGPRTPVRGLTLAGADSIAHGVVGAMVGGMTAYTSSLGFLGVIDFFRQLMRVTENPTGPS